MMKKLTAFLLAMTLAFGIIGCFSAQAADTAEQLDKEIGAFEITAAQRELAANNEAGLPVLDAGRGNPNWINTLSRYAFSRLMEFSLGECERTMKTGDMAGQAEEEGIGARFDAAMNADDRTDAFLIASVNYCVSELGMDKDALVKELVDGIIGCFYPSPSRSLPHTEEILNTYLQSTLYNGEDLSEETLVFPVEGGTAAICYIFDSLHHNRLLKEGDKIAIAEPIFTPYLQIPDVNNYGLVSINVTSTEADNWDIPDEAFETLADPEIKAFFLVNPSNPASHQLSFESLKKLEEAVRKNPSLIIITDDVYGTFVNDFETVYAAIPHNTILVYSFSKLYGVTGWRVGMVAMNRDNVCDKLLADLPDADRDFLHQEYSIVTEEPESMSFMERMVADSRSIGLYHTSGLSTPQQVFMDLLAPTHLINEENDEYINLTKDVIHERHKALYEVLGIEEDNDEMDAEYYAFLDWVYLAEKHYGMEFGKWMSENIDDLTFLNDMAGRFGVVLMYGPGFGGPSGSVRVSLANLNTEDYREIGHRAYLLVADYYGRFLEESAA